MDIMLIFFATLFIPALSSVGAEHSSTIDALSLTVVKSKRGIVEPVIRDYKYHQGKAPAPGAAGSIQTENAKSLAYYQDVKPIAQRVASIGQNYGAVAPKPYSNHFNRASSHVSLPAPHHQPSQQNYGNLFSVSGGYKVGGEQKPSQPIQSYREIKPYTPTYSPLNGNSAIGVSNVGPGPGTQIPVYKSSYTSPKAVEFTQLSSPYLSPPLERFSDAGSKKIPVLQLQREDFPYSQQLVLNPLPRQGQEFNFDVGPQQAYGATFSSPLSSFQGQVVPIQSGSGTQFPQFKGASVDAFPVGELAKTPGAYQAFQTQPQLHFANTNARVPVNPVRPFQEIRADVEIIKKKPTTPPPSKDDGDDEEVDDGYKSSEKEYGRGSQEDDYEYKPSKYFNEPQAQGDFKPSKSFPFKQYDDTFGKYTKQNYEQGAEEKPLSKYRDFSSSNEDDDSEVVSAAKFRVDNSSPGPVHGKYEEVDGDEEHTEHHEKRQNAEDTSDYVHKSSPTKYYDIDFERDFEESYKKEIPRQKYVHVKEVPEIEYTVSRSSGGQKNKGEEPAGQGSRMTYKYQKTPRTQRDSEGYGSSPSKATTKIIHEETFEFKNPANERHFRHA